MNKSITHLSLVVAIIATLMTSSCVTQDEGKIPSEDKQTKDLKIPLNFDWNMSEEIVCEVNAETDATISLYLDKECKEDLLTETNVTPGTNRIEINAPKGTKAIYTKYTDNKNQQHQQESTVESSKSTVNVPNDAVIAVPETNYYNTLIYPANWGSVMFEDLFPALGDYDFNDYVMNYQIYLDYGTTKEYARSMRMSLYVNAIGGSLDYEPYVRIIGSDASNFNFETTYHPNGLFIRNNTKKGVSVDKVAATNELVLHFKNMHGNPYANAASFYNTVNGNVTKIDELTQVTVYLNFKEEIPITELKDKNIDIFLANGNRSKEIHLRGIMPVFNQYDFTQKGISKDVPYASENNLVWAIKIPRTIRHIVEKADFSKAYTQFANWATSGGYENPNWYIRTNNPLNYDANLLIRWGR
ncbi:MAG: LruC domain-containing protein [Muribaculaceae bacterium]|nr:LruC domain-containing protein [Muribaculaceae bacterium]